MWANWAKYRQITELQTCEGGHRDVTVGVFTDDSRERRSYQQNGRWGSPSGERLSQNTLPCRLRDVASIRVFTAHTPDWPCSARRPPISFSHSLDFGRWGASWRALSPATLESSAPGVYASLSMRKSLSFAAAAAAAAAAEEPSERDLLHYDFGSRKEPAACETVCGQTREWKLCRLRSRR